MTVTDVYPGTRFGELRLDENRVAMFREKPQAGQGWINGGFLVLESEFFNLIKDDRVTLEMGPMEQAVSQCEMMAL